MSDHIGIVACSAPGAALCYETICAESPDLLGVHAHPEVSLHTYNFADHVRFLENGDWQGIGKMLAESAQKLASIGAKFAICPDNTAHQGLEYAMADSSIPWLHIVDPVLAEASRIGARRVGVLGTRYLMDGPVYSTRFQSAGVNYCVPLEADREVINTIIFGELVYGRVSERAREALQRIIEVLHQGQACEAIVLGCTELPLAVKPEDAKLPLLDSTRLLARAAIQRSIALLE